MDFKQKRVYKFEDLVQIVKILRSPNGCPWDREQDHKSIRRDFIEEVYEAIEAIDTDDTELLKEELGDVMLQVVFHAELETEKQSFNIDDVCDGVCKKLIIRHPHVFGDTVAETTEKVLDNWDKIKMQTKAQTTVTEAMNSVSKALPSLIRSEKIQKKAAKAGFDWDDTNGALQKVSEELDEVYQAIANNDRENTAEELGDLLFAVVNVSRFVGVDSEQALADACEKFISRFSKVEKLATERELDMKTASLQELDALWDEVKAYSAE